MKEEKRLFLSCIVALLTWISGFTQLQYCENLGFEMGDFTNWEGYTWKYSTEHPEINTDTVEGIVDRRHTIIRDQSAYDPFTGNALKLIPEGYQYSARLGDAIRPEVRESPRCWQQSLRYTMQIDQNNALLIIKFALVLQYIEDHSVIEEPHFRFTLYDQNGNIIPDCANYDVYATNNSVKGFQTYITDEDKQIQWRDWTTVGINLSNYINQTITIEFLTTDCTQTYHFGYGYIVAACMPLNITLKYCTDDTYAILTAPQGFEGYSWTNDAGNLVDTFQILQVKNPEENATYTCEMTSATGCDVSLQSTINRYTPKVDFSSYMINCNSNIVQLTDLSTSNRGSFYYLWDFGDGQTSTERNPLYKFITSGIHQVTLKIFNTPSTCTDVLTKDVESFSPPLVGIEGDSTYCPNTGIVLKAYGAYEYEWNNGSKNDSIEVFAPGGEVWLIGRSSTGCSDTNYITISEEPDWDFLAEGDTMLCVGDSTILKVTGAYSCHWNTGDSSDSIIVSSPGTYFNIGQNKRGCKKTKTFQVELIPPPNVNFTLSDYTLNERENKLTGSLSAQSDVRYDWDMGDGSTETGANIQHEYMISNGILSYIITLTATDQYGCLNSFSEIIDVIPFIPNVFSPNNDGINDIFMPEIELQVFDRNGILIYKGSEGWDGKYKGQPVDPDTYFYSIYYVNRFQQEQNKKGYVTLVR